MRVLPRMDVGAANEGACSIGMSGAGLGESAGRDMNADLIEKNI